MTPASLVPSPRQQRSEYGLGASLAAAALGVSDYRGPIDAWLVLTERAEPFAGNEKTRWGEILEPVIRANYVEQHRVAVHVPPVSLYHRQLPWLRATPDGIVLDTDGEWSFVGPQVKNVGLRMAPFWGDVNAPTAPTDYLIQGVVEMAVTDLPRIDFAILIGGQEYREVTIHRDHELEDEVLAGCAAFWKLVESDTQPAIDDSDTFRRHLLKQIKKRTVIEATASDVAKLERWREVVVDIARLKREEKTLKNELLSVMAANDAAKMTSSLGDISIGNPRRKTRWKEVAHETRPLLLSMPSLERELLHLRSLVAEIAPEADPLLMKIDGLRGQLRLVGGLTNWDELVALHTKIGDPSINRPRAWTKDLGDDAEEHEE